MKMRREKYVLKYDILIYVGYHQNYLRWKQKIYENLKNNNLY